MQSIPRPSDAPRAQAQGHDSDRILILGAGLAVGWGVTSHDLALPGHLTRALSGLTGRGALLDLFADPEMTAANASQAVTALNLTRYDAVVVVLGVNEALHLTSPQRWRRSMTDLLASIRSSAPDSTPILVTGIQPIRSISVFDSPLGALADRHARALNLQTASICSAMERTSFVPLDLVPEAQAGRHRTPGEYAYWAALLARSLMPMLSAHHHPEERRRGEFGTRVSISELRTALQDLPPVDSERTEARIDLVLDLARRVFHADSAMISLVDGDGQRIVAARGGAQEDHRLLGLAEIAMRGRGAMLVQDIWDDPRVMSDPRFTDDAVAGRSIRFYAGFPIEQDSSEHRSGAPGSGERIGILSVIDRHPRRRTGDIDQALFAQLERLARRELSPLLPAVVDEATAPSDHRSTEVSTA